MNCHQAYPWSQRRLKQSALQVMVWLFLVAGSGCSHLIKLGESGPASVRPWASGLVDVGTSMQLSADERLAQLSDEKIVAALEQAETPPHSLAPEQSQLQNEEIQLASHEMNEEIELDTLPLTVMNAMNAAMRHNPHLRVVAFLPVEAETQKEIEQAKFDTSISAGAQVLNANQQVGSAIDANAIGTPEFSSTSIGPANSLPSLVQFEKRFTSGTIARIGANTSYNQNSPAGQFLVYNPAYQSGLTAVIEQPLLRGFGSKNNLAGSRIAVMGHQRSLAEVQSEINLTLNDVQKAYWLAWLAQSEVNTYDELVQQAGLTLNVVEKQLELGEGGLVETAQAKENLEALKVEREQARQRYQSAENRLKAELGLPASDQRRIQYVDRPFADQFFPNLQEGLEVARKSRPEISANQLAVQQAQLNLERSQNFARPDVNAYAGYGMSGLNNGFLGSLSNLTSTEYGNMTLGVRVQHVFGRRAEKAAVERAELTVRRQMLAVRETQQQIEQQVKEAFDAISTSWSVLQSQRERTKAAQTQYETYAQLHDSGELDLDRLIRARSLLANALQERSKALIDYNLALANWNYTIGVTSETVPEEALASEPNVAGG